MFQVPTDDERLRERFNRRAFTAGLLSIAGLGVVAGRLYQIQVAERGRFAPLADHNRIAVDIVAPERGRIIDRFGAVLADNAEGYRCVIVPALVGPLGPVLDRLQRLIRIDAETRERILARARRQRPTLPIVVAEELSFEEIARINLEAPHLPGVETVSAGRRRYHLTPAVGPIVGYVGGIERLALDDDPLMRLPGARLGKTGIERAFERELRGVGGTRRREVDARGRIVRDLERVAPKPGRDIVATVDVVLQEQLGRRLARERRAAAAVLAVGSGEVLAMASAPQADVAALQGGIGAQAWDRLKGAAGDPLFNRATSGQYPPGSTFKMVTALAALEAGVIGLGDTVHCHGVYEYAGHSFRCWNRTGHGACNCHRALRESCDVYFYEIARRVGIRAIAAMGHRLGFGQTFGNGFGVEKAGLMPTPDWKRGTLGRGWLGGETLIAGIGQGYVLATPLQLAVMMARLASGRAVAPIIARPADAELPPAPPLKLKRLHLEAVRRALVAVVNEPAGTGRRARLEAAVTVAGKTGTSQVGRGGGTAWSERDHALFVAYLPAERPKYAVSAIVEHGGSGGSIAAPLVREIMELLLARDPGCATAYPDRAVADTARLGG
ncbi:MAG: penicillin-binding protein 2 [Hyphomicrobiaceae bacterium]